MTFKEITELIKLVKKLELAEFKMQDGEFQISLRSSQRTKTTTVNSPAIIPMSTPGAVAAPIAASTMQQPAAAVVAPAQENNGAPVEVMNEAKDDSENYLEVKSPIVGTFYRSASPDKPAYIKVGDTIAEGDVVCIVEAMKLFNEIESEISGKIVKVMVEDASPVEYDQVLFLVDPNG